MSQQQSMTRVLEALQRTLHELIDLHLKAGMPFEGITISALPLQYRDAGLSVWDVAITPHTGQVEEVEETIVEEDQDEPELDEDVTLEESFKEGFDEGRKE
jgi:hypothetical protein